MFPLGGLRILPEEPGDTEKRLTGCKSKHKGHIVSKESIVG